MFIKSKYLTMVFNDSLKLLTMNLKYTVTESEAPTNNSIIYKYLHGVGDWCLYYHIGDQDY